MSNFIQDCISGDALLSEIDDYIDNWHEGDSDLPLHEFLGMSLDEYSAFVAESDVLPLVITAHRENLDFKEFAAEELSAMAARSDDRSKAELLKTWLKQRGLWE